MRTRTVCGITSPFEFAVPMFSPCLLLTHQLVARTRDLKTFQSFQNLSGDTLSRLTDKMIGINNLRTKQGDKSTSCMESTSSGSDRYCVMYFDWVRVFCSMCSQKLSRTWNITQQSLWRQDFWIGRIHWRRIKNHETHRPCAKRRQQKVNFLELTSRSVTMIIKTSRQQLLHSNLHWCIPKEHSSEDGARDLLGSKTNYCQQYPCLFRYSWMNCCMF